MSCRRTKAAQEQMDRKQNDRANSQLFIRTSNILFSPFSPRPMEEHLLSPHKWQSLNKALKSTIHSLFMLGTHPTHKCERTFTNLGRTVHEKHIYA
jgi:hypothetical protein